MDEERDYPESRSLRQVQQSEAPVAEAKSRRGYWQLQQAQREELEKSKLKARKDCGVYAVVCFGFFTLGRFAFGLSQYLRGEQALAILGMISMTAAVVTGLATCVKVVGMGALELPPGPPDTPETVMKRKDMWLLIKLAVVFFVAGQIAFALTDHVAQTGPGPRPMDALGAICCVTAVVLGTWAAVKISQVWMS